MKLHPGTRFRLSGDAEFRRQMNARGWAGCETGTVEEIDGRRATVCFGDEQPWAFTREEAERFLEPV